MSDAAALVHPLLVRAQTRRGRGRSATGGGRSGRRRSSSRRRATARASGSQAGEALQRVLLRATAAGLFASYFAQPIETPRLRRRLAEAIGEPGAPQVMFRLGYGLEPCARRRGARWTT